MGSRQPVDGGRYGGQNRHRGNHENVEPISFKHFKQQKDGAGDNKRREIDNPIEASNTMKERQNNVRQPLVRDPRFSVLPIREDIRFRHFDPRNNIIPVRMCHAVSVSAPRKEFPKDTIIRKIKNMSAMEGITHLANEETTAPVLFVAMISTRWREI